MFRLAKSLSLTLTGSLIALAIVTLSPGLSVAAAPPANALSSVKEVATGSTFACALLIAKTVDCWGANDSGELGNGSFGYQDPTPEPVPGLSQVKQIAAGVFESCAVLDDGTVDCWGMTNPQPSNSFDDGVPTPAAIAGLTGVAQVGAGDGFECALMMAKTVKCWGNNFDGQLGDGSTAFSSAPEQVMGLSSVSQLAVGEFNSCALLENRTVDCWGDDGSGQLGDGLFGVKNPFSSRVVKVRGLTKVTWVATGNGTSCAVISGGATKCWGNNVSDQLLSTRQFTTAPVTVGALTKISKLAMGQTNGCALLEKGTVECWGDNQLQGTYYGGPSEGLSYWPYPTVVSGLANVTQISTGIGDGVSQFTCAVMRDTDVKCWGFDYDGELGHGLTGNEAAPTAVIGLSGVSAISAGADHTCALLETGSIDCWGLDMYGELGNGAKSDSPKPIAVPSVTGAIQVSAGEFDTCALLGGGGVKCWGLNTQGELGDGHTSAPPGPVSVSGLSNVVQISVGWTHACALLAAGTVECWGSNTSGQLGTGNNTESAIPVKVSGLSNVTSIAVGDQDSCAVLADGTVQCWGNGSDGQLGDGAYNNSSLPVAVQSLSGVTEISMGDLSTCALLASGTVECWGNDFEDQLGNFEAAAGGESNASPVEVAQIYGATDVGSGGQTSCALTNAQMLACWGYSAFFQYPSSDGIIGNWSPTPITDITGISQISLGEYHVCALLVSGTVDCWGDNFDGQDGNGVLGFSASPVWVVSPSSPS